MQDDRRTDVFDRVAKDLIDVAGRTLSFLNRSTGRLVILDRVGATDVRITVNVDVDKD